MSCLANEIYYENRLEQLMNDFMLQGYDEEQAEIKALNVLSTEEMIEP